MARGARLRLAGVPMHIVQRGNNRGPCFFCDDDRLVYLAMLGPLARDYECGVHAYVLMTNHVHLLLSSSTVEGPSLLMKHLGQRYVQYVNRHRKRTGTLWEGRFKSSLVQQQRYLFACYRYIEMNPVRAGLVEAPEDWRWSSYRTNAGLQPSTLITPHDEYVSLGVEPYERGRRYRAMFPASAADKDVDNAIRSALRGSYALGDESFRSSVAALLGRRVEAGRPGPRRSEIGDRPRSRNSGSVPDFGP